MAHTGNSKNNRSVHVTYIPESDPGWSDTWYCFVCKKLWNGVNASNLLKVHLINDHGFTDED